MCHCNAPFKLNLMLNELDMMEADIAKIVYAVASLIYNDKPKVEGQKALSRLSATH